MQNKVIWMLGCACAGAVMFATVGCDDTVSSEDREDIVYVDSCVGCDAAPDVPADTADATPTDVPPTDAAVDIDPSGCQPSSVDEVCTAREAGFCGLMGGCDANGCVCAPGYAVSMQGDCLPQVQDCTGGSNMPARWHVPIGVEDTGDNGIAKLFPYREEVEGRDYHALVAVWKQGMTPDPEPRRMGLHFVHTEGTTPDDFGPEVRWPLAANEDEIWTRYSKVGGLDSLLLIDIISHWNPQTFFAIDNRGGPAQESVELIAGVTEVLPGTWPRGRIDLGRELELETGRIRDIRALAVKAAPIPDGGYSVYVAIFDDANPDEGIAIYNLSLTINFEWISGYKVAALDAEPTEFLALEVHYGYGVVVNRDGELWGFDAAFGDGLWEPLNAGDTPTLGMQQPMDVHRTTCLDNVRILRGANQTTSAWLSGGGALQFAQGTDVLDTQRLFTETTGPTIQLVWNQQDENSVDAHLFMLDVSVVDWAAGPVRDLGRVNFGTSPANGAEGLQVVFNAFDTTVAMLDRTVYRALPVRLEGLDVFIDVGAGCD